MEDRFRPPPSFARRAQPQVELNQGQAYGLEATLRWLANHSDGNLTFVGDGEAGTGKTVLARAIADCVPGVVCASLTGRAAANMAKHGLPNTSTLHRLLYKPPAHLQRLRELMLTLKEARRAGNHARITAIEAQIVELQSLPSRWEINPESPLRDAPLCLVDESSMVGTTIGRDLMSFRRPVEALGDAFQLAPVNDRPYFAREPDFRLTEIHRQKAGSPIIKLASAIRRGETGTAHRYADGVRLRLATSYSPSDEEILWADQILCHTRWNRWELCERVRELKGLPFGRPTAGEKIVCLSNNAALGLFNGATWIVDGCEPDEDDGRLLLWAHLQDEPATSSSLFVAEAEFFKANRNAHKHPPPRGIAAFTWAGCLSVYTAQGGEWPRVLILDDYDDVKPYLETQEAHDSHRLQAPNWRYTALTRAAEAAVIVKRPAP